MLRKELMDKAKVGEWRYSESFLMSRALGKSSRRVWAKREMVTEWIGVAIVARETGGKLSGAGEGEPHPASGQVDEGQEVLSIIEEERDEVVERVEAL